MTDTAEMGKTRNRSTAILSDLERVFVNLLESESSIKFQNRNQKWRKCEMWF